MDYFAFFVLGVLTANLIEWLVDITLDRLDKDSKEE